MICGAVQNCHLRPAEGKSGAIPFCTTTSAGLFVGDIIMNQNDPMIGKKFHRLTVLEFAGLSKNKSRLYKCQCDCGRIVIKRGCQIRKGQIKSCGCYRREDSAKKGRATATHHHCVNGKWTPTYRSWSAMRDRCTRKTHPHYARYGGCGITICERWQKFENFLADMGIRPEGKTLDRIDGSEGYSPENCRWATPKEQQRNMRSNRLLALHGQTKCISEWSEITGLRYSTIRERLNRGWTIERALSFSGKETCKC